MDQLAAILQSPVGYALLLGAALLWLNRERSADRTLWAARETKLCAEWEKRDAECVARVKELADQYTEYLQTQGVETVKALARNTVALDNHAAQIVANTAATQDQTATFKKNFPYTNA